MMPYHMHKFLLTKAGFLVVAVVLLQPASLTAESGRLKSQQSAITLRIRMDQAADFSLSKAPLRYNKAFAYSLTLDDGLADAYAHAFQILNGGFIEANRKSYPGLFFTDGCGNDVPFTAAVAWNSVNREYQDIHVNTPGYVSWNQLSELYEAGWDVLNHSYSHATAEGTDFFWQIDQNQRRVYEMTGIIMTQFVIPGGGDYLPYLNQARAYGMNAIFAHKSDLEGYPDGLRVDDARAWKGISVFRDYKYDQDFGTHNITDHVDATAANSTRNNHLWYNDFTHRVHLTEVDGSLRVETFEYYMQEIEKRFGKKGLDNVWMASVQQVWEYLFIRDHTPLSIRQNGRDLTVTINTSEVPDNLRTKSMSLLFSSATGFTVEVLTQGVRMQTNRQTGLINLEWDENLSSSEGEEILPPSDEAPRMRLYPNPVSEEIRIEIGASAEPVKMRLLDIRGQVLYDREMPGQISPTTLIINRSDIQAAPGTYLLELSTGQSRALHRIIFL